MENYLAEREKLQDLLNKEWENYTEAIRADKSFNEVKGIFMRIKELKMQIADVTNKICEQLSFHDETEA